MVKGSYFTLVSLFGIGDVTQTVSCSVSNHTPRRIEIPNNCKSLISSEFTESTNYERQVFQIDNSSKSNSSGRKFTK